MGSMWTREVSTGGGLGQSLPYVPRGIAPKFPVECPPYVYIAWERRFEVFITNQGLGHTISPDAPQIAVISCVDDAYLFGNFGEALVTDHRRTVGMVKLVRWPSGTGTAEKYIAGTVAKKGRGQWAR